MDRVILHCDLNNFFASVETVLNPTLKGKAIAVCGSQETRHGIVLAKSEEAKKYGVKTAQTNWMAKQKCPHLLLIKPHYEAYKKYSKLAQNVYQRFTNQVEPFGIDECWLDITGSIHLFGSAMDIAYNIKETIKKEIGLTISIGISYNKVFAKLASDLKKPDAITSISPNEVPHKVWPLPASYLLGVGKNTSQKLHLYGIDTIGELANTDCVFLQKHFGKNGSLLWLFANGKDQTPVKYFNEYIPPQSIGHSTTCPKDLTNPSEVLPVFFMLAEKVSRRLEMHNLLAEKLQISIKDQMFITREFQTSLPYPARASNTLKDAAMKLFQIHYDWHLPIRSLGIRTIHLCDTNAPVQLNLFNDYKHFQKQEAAESAINTIRQRYGNDSIKKGFL